MAGRELAVPHIYIYIIYILHIYFFPQSACMSPSSSIYFTAFISYFGQMPLCQVCSRGPGVSSPHSAARHEPPSDPGRHPPLSSPLLRPFRFAHRTPTSHSLIRSQSQCFHLPSSEVTCLPFPDPLTPLRATHSGPPMQISWLLHSPALCGVDPAPGSSTGVGVATGKTQTSWPSETCFLSRVS